MKVLLLIGLILACIVIAYPSCAQQSDGTKPKGTELNGSLYVGIEHGCGPGDAGLESTLNYREVIDEAMARKLSGMDYTYDPYSMRPWAGRAAEAVKKINGRLEDLSRHGARTSLLVYDISMSLNLCVWLFQPNEAPIVSITSLPPYPLANGFRDAAGINFSSETFAYGSPATPTPQDQRDVEARQRDARIYVSSSGKVLLPLEIRNALSSQATPTKRLLVLPVYDVGIFPLGALHFRDSTLGEHMALVQLPSLREFLIGKEFRFHRPTSKLDSIIIGNPDLSDGELHFQPIFGAQREAKRVAELFNGEAWLMDEASRPHFDSKLNANGDVRMIYLATHGVSNARAPLSESFVALHKGYLRGEEIRTLRLLQSPLVVMSACQTAVGKVFEGGVVGLSQAWLRAGAGQVVGSLWRVNDQSTSELMQLFAERVNEGFAPEFALQRALMKVRRDSPVQGRLDPTLWNGFVVFGMPSAVQVDGKMEN